QYGAQATIWIDATERERWGQGQDRGPIRQGQLLDPQAWVDLLKSYVVLDQVVRDQRLFVSPESRADEPLVATLQVTGQYRPGAYRLKVDSDRRTYTLATVEGQVVERGTVGDSIGTRLGLAWAPAASTLPTDRPPPVALGAPGGAGGGAQGAELDPKFGTFFNMQFDRERIQQDREALQRLLAQVRDSTGISPDELAVVGSVQANPDL